MTRSGSITTPGSAWSGTSVLRQVVTTGRRLTLLNRHAISARRGLILSGAAGTGKTTAITQLGKTHEAIRPAAPPRAGERIPVIYVTVPPAATPRMLAIEFARFLGLPDPGPGEHDRHHRGRLRRRDRHVAPAWSLVDEIHNMQLATRSGAEVSDILKYFSERIPATFVYAGIDVERHGLLSGTRGEPDRRALHPDPHAAVPARRRVARAWSPPSKTPCACTATSPAPWPGSTATCTSAPAG